MKTLIKQLAAKISTLETIHQKWAAEAILDLMIEGVISERESKRQLEVNGITI